MIMKMIIIVSCAGRPGGLGLETVGGGAGGDRQTYIYIYIYIHVYIYIYIL